MKEFVMQHMDWLLCGVGVIVFIIVAIRMFKKAKKIDTEGIEANAEVSKITEHWDPDTSTSSYTVYVTFTDGDGETRECALSSKSKRGYTVGDPVRILYLPDEKKMVRSVD